MRTWSFASSASLVAACLALATGCAGSTSVEDEASATAALASAASLARDYQGSVAGQQVMLRIEPRAAAVTGSYFYLGNVTKGETIALNGTVQGNHFVVDESVNGQRTGSFDGAIGERGKVTGTWTSPGGRRHPFSLAPVTAPKVVTRHIKDVAAVADPDAPFHTCHVDIKYVDVFGLPDASNEAALDRALAMDALPLDKNPQGQCEDWYSLDSTSTVKLNERGLLVVEIGAESNGGAYPNYSLMWVNASTKTGKTLTLVDVVKSEKMSAFKEKVKDIYRAQQEAGDFLLEIVDRAFESPETVEFELGKQGIRVSMFNRLPHAAQAEDGDGALVKWDDLALFVDPASEAAVLAHH